MTNIFDDNNYKVFNIFSSICKYPRPSGHPIGLKTYLTEFCKEHNLQCHIDEFDNVIIQKPANEGYENKPAVILQAHTDMVPIVRSGFEHDFQKDPIDIYVDGDFIKAKNTTLGADDGIGLALALALITDKNLKTGPIIVICTSDEETTMRGAFNLDKKYLELGDYLINLDSEEDGIAYVGCAGSFDFNTSFKGQLQSKPGLICKELEINGLFGGHSGADIHLNRLNAIILLGKTLEQIYNISPFYIANIKGGQRRNAIASMAQCTICFESFDSDIEQKINEIISTNLHNYKNIEKNIAINFKDANASLVFDSTLSQQVISFINNVPYGPLAMSKIDPQIVQTSNCLSMVSTTEDHIDFECLTRSLSESELDILTDDFNKLCKNYSTCSCTILNRHTSWEPEDDNLLINMVKVAYNKVTGKELKITVIHAGLECGNFAKLVNIPMISIGPLVLHAHTPDEMASISSTKVLYQTLFNTLESM